MKYGKHYKSHSRRYKRRYHVSRPLVTDPVYCELKQKATYAVKNYQAPTPLGSTEWGANLGVLWQQTGRGSSGNPFPNPADNFWTAFDNAAPITRSRWHKMYKNWDQYAIKSVKIRWIPSGTANIGSNSDDSVTLSNIWTVDSPDYVGNPNNLSTLDFLQNSSFRAHEADKPFTIYNSC